MKIKIGVLAGNKKIVSSVQSVLEKILNGRLEFSIEYLPTSDDIRPSQEAAKQAAISQIFRANSTSIDYYISIVNGVQRDFDSMYGFTYSVVSDSDRSRFGFGYSARFPIPEYIAHAIESAGSPAILNEIIPKEKSLVSESTAGLLTIEELTAKSVSVALLPFNFFPVPLPETAAPELTKFVGEINQIQQSSLASQINQLDFTPQKIADTTKSLSALSAVEDPEDNADSYDDIYMNGVTSIRNGEVGVCIMAGGQGSRLKAPVPKAMMDIGLPLHQTLLEIQLRRIKKLIKVFNNYGQKVPCIPVYILTSESTHSTIAAYLKEHKNFGVDPIMLVKQPQLPARLVTSEASKTDNEGPFVLSEKWKVLAAPNGNGSIFAALRDSGAIDDMKKRGVLYLDVHPIDNVLARPADPYMVGAMLYEGGDVAIKVIRKMPKEKIGTICRRDGRTVVVEYSEIPPGQEEKFIWGNTGLHLYSVEVIERAAFAELPYHIALKKENIINEAGEKVLADVKKFERFIFDALEYADNTILIECMREQEFAPVKNAPGAPTDSPDTARELLIALHKQWAEDAGIEIEGTGPLEFSPEITYAGEGLDELGLSKIVLPFSL